MRSQLARAAEIRVVTAFGSGFGAGMGVCRATAGASQDNEDPREEDPGGENATANMLLVRTETSVDAGEGPAGEDAAGTSVDAGDEGPAAAPLTQDTTAALSVSADMRSTAGIVSTV
jgi:hypothetical protein